MCNEIIISYSISGEYFVGGETGMAIHGTACTAKSVGISVDVNAYEPHIIAGSMAHMIGHNVGMGHDDKSTYNLCIFIFLGERLEYVSLSLEDNF